MTRKEILEVQKIEKKQKKILKYGFNHRFHHSIMEAKKQIRSKKLGKIIFMRGVYGKAGSIDFDKEWRQYKKFSGGGILFDQGIHMLDLFRYFTHEEFRCIGSKVSTLFWNIKLEDNAFAILKSQSNVITSLHSSATQWKHKFLLEIILQKGYVILDGILSTTRSYAPETLIVGKQGFKNIKKSMGKPREIKMVFEQDESWDIELSEFLNAIKYNKKIKNGNSNDALKVMSLMEEIYTKST